VIRLPTLLHLQKSLQEVSIPAESPVLVCSIAGELITMANSEMAPHLSETHLLSLIQELLTLKSLQETTTPVGSPQQGS